MARSTGDENDEEITRANTIDMDSDSNSDLGLEREGASDDTGGTMPVVLTDPHLLNCSVCKSPLSSPIYHCVCGHIECSSCCVEENYRCFSCGAPIGDVRSEVMEKVIASLRVECKNKRFGCKEALIYHKKPKHEDSCPYTLCFCPFSSCGFSGSSKNVYKHFSKHHSSSATSFTYDNVFLLRVVRSQKYIILQEVNEGVIFILNHDIQGHGRVFSVDCIGLSTYKNAFVYQLTVKCIETCLSLETEPEVFTKWQEHTPDNTYLTIPSRFSDFPIKVCIKKTHPVA